MSDAQHSYAFDLPQALIAQYPTADRTGSRLLEVHDQGWTDRVFAEIETLLRPGDLLVVNNTRVVKARLFATKATGGRAEVLFERALSECEALCQVRVSKPLKVGGELCIGADRLVCLGRKGMFYHLTFPCPVWSFLEQHGYVPLPPYIQRCDDSELDLERYQTVYASKPGAVAAPTAGLHFDQALLERLSAQGIRHAEVTLHVGVGTFAPVRGHPADHQMHSESYEVSQSAARRINQTQANGGRIVAVGTTVVRTLETVAAENDGVIVPCSGDTSIFIQPGFEFRTVDALVTNFHLPNSTLMILVCAFAGYERVMAAYRHAVIAEYRFFSYGDAMFLESNQNV